MATQDFKPTKIEDFLEICRLCLSSGTLHPIHVTEVDSIEGPELLEYSIGIQFDATTTFPHNICEKCLTDLYNIYTFKKKCYEREELFQGILAKEVKVECPMEMDETDNSGKEQDSESVETIPDLKADTDDGLSTHKHKVIKKTNRCPVCKEYVNPSRLNAHIIAHSQQPVECEICRKTFSSRRNLKRHEHKHIPDRCHLCQKCGKRFSQGDSLRHHLVKCDPDAEVPVAKPKVPEMACHICGITYFMKDALISHIKRHENDTGAPVEKQKGSFLCEKCPRTYKTKITLTQHITNTHAKNGNHTCDYCGKSFTSYQGLHSHQKIHTGEKPYSCIICGKAFIQRANLGIHMRSHNGHRPFQCHICERSFIQHPHLKTHLKTHTGERSYQCKVCGKAFAVNGNLTVHMRRHTGETPYVCPICDKGFYDSSSMKRHKLRHKYSEPDVKQESEEEEPSEGKSMIILLE